MNNAERPHPPITIVDRDDNVIGAMPLFDALREGKTRRVARIVLLDTDGRIFLQRRGAHVHFFPCTWDVSAAGHVDEGESYEATAARELEEELGLKGLPLTLVTTFFGDEGEPDAPLPVWSGLFSASWDGTPITLADKEVYDGKWMTRAEIENALVATPEDFGKNFRMTWDVFINTVQ